MPDQRTAEQKAILDKIHAHLAELSAKHRFPERLAKENRLPLGVAYTLINEYAKFLFIAREGLHSVTPPPWIDKVWHLHLLHTEAYWGDLCPNILRMSLHHVPATGSRQDATRLEDSSEQTILSYRKFFGEPTAAWLTPKDKINRPLLRNIGFLLCGLALGSAVLALILGNIAYTFISLALWGIPASCLFAMANQEPSLKSFLPKSRSGKGSPASCGSNACSTSDNGHSGGGHSCGGHSCGGGGH